MKRTNARWVIIGLLILLVSIQIGQLLKGDLNTANAQDEMSQTTTTLMVEVVNGRHGSIWKFIDRNRDCYFNSSGGIWCTP